MGSYRLRVHVIVGTFVAVLVLLVAGQRLLHAARVEQPLLSELRAVAGVAAAELQRDASGLVVSIRLKNDADLAAAYSQAYDLCAARLGSRMSGLRVEDSRTPQLEEVLRSASLELWEAVGAGRYSQAGAAVETRARQIGARCSVTMDQRFIYVQIWKGSARLCHVVDWRSAGPAGQAGSAPAGARPTASAVGGGRQQGAAEQGAAEGGAG